MPLIRILLLLVVLAGLTLLLAQNWSPILPLVFLGMRTQALPLAIWILLSLATGIITSLLITGLFKLSNYFAVQQSLKRRRNIGVTQNSSAQRSEAPSSTNRPPSSNINSNPSDASDWDTDTSLDDKDWDVAEDAEKSQDDVNSTVYERQQQPKSGSQSGSGYSYSYQEPKNSGVGKTESVYDAEYRVITPPYRQTDTAKKEEDWGFEDDDDEGE